MLSEFKKFAMRGNVVDMAIGIVIGGAFGKITTSLVNDIIMPPIGLVIAGDRFMDLMWVLKEGADGGAAVAVQYGAFVNHIVNFILIAFAMFLVVKTLNNLKRKEAVPATEPTEKNCPHCLMTVPVAATKCGHCTSSIAGTAARG